MIEALKIEETRKTKDLTGLAAGDNLDIEGKREVVGAVSRNDYFQRITTLRIISARQCITIYRDYFATDKMLADGVLEPVKTERQPAIRDDLQFYSNCLIPQNQEAIA